MTIDDLAKPSAALAASHLALCPLHGLPAFAGKFASLLPVSLPLTPYVLEYQSLVHSVVDRVAYGLEQLGITSDSAEQISHGAIEYALPAAALAPLTIQVYRALLRSQPLTTLGLGPIAPDDPLNMVTSYEGDIYDK